MKQPVAIILAAVFAYTVGVHGILLSVLIQKTKSEVLDKMEKDALPENAVSLSFPLKDGKVVNPDFSLEEDQEFLYQGKMYDIVKQEIYTDRITYYCLQDQQETNLKALLTSFHLPEKTDLPFNNLLHLLKSLSQDYSLSLFSLVRPVLPKQKGFTMLSVFFNEYPLSRVSPPPEL